MPWRRALTVMGLVSGCIGCDQGSKRLAVEFLRGSAPVEFFYGTVRFLYAENRGAWGSLGAQWAGPLKTLAFVLAPGLLLLGMFIHLLRASAVRPATLIACSLIIGGGLGNLVDRVRAGSVVDFMYVGIGRVGTNIFNVADVAVVAGVLLLFFNRATKPARRLPS